MKHSQTSALTRSALKPFNQKKPLLYSTYKIVKKVLIFSILAILLGVIALLINYFTYSYLTKSKIFTSSDSISFNKVGLVLGTSKYYRNGNLNQYYKSRIDGAFELFSKGKVNYLLLSGDNRSLNYNEPITMRKDLIERGIPANAIFLDFAGFRTLDSIIRAKSVFQTSSYTIITQQFHCERALFIARFNDINAVCLAVADPYSKFIQLREVLARANATIDIFILNKAPYFLGPQISIPSEQDLKSVDLNAVEQPNTRKSMN